jgi:uncharacterized membrane protein
VARGTAIPLNRIERILAFVLGAVAVLTVAAIVALLIGRAAGVTALSTGIWPVVGILPLLGLPIVLVLAIVLIVVMGVRRRRLAADDARR